MSKIENRSRPILKRFFVDEEENLYIKDRLLETGKSFSQFTRDMIFQGQVNVIDFQVLKDLRYEINKIGINVNQIAKQVNENDVTSAEDLAACLVELKTIREMVNHVIKEQVKKEE
ncbi:plasmid mobilization protein [Streptococcus cameli]